LKHLIEGYSTIDEQAHITGVALIPRISRNDNLYTKEELKRFDNITVPLNWEHDSGKQIGSVTFHYNQELETVYYDGMITDEASADLARNKTLFTSIEADPVTMKQVCNGPDDCFQMPFGLVPVGLALTETPGVPETSVKVLEHIIRECAIDKELEKKYEQGRGEPNDDCVSRKVAIIKNENPNMSADQAVAIAISMCSEKEVKEYLQKIVFGLHEDYCTTPKLDKKKKKKIAQVPNRFEFVESKHEWLGSGLIDEAKILTFDHSSSFVGRVTYEKEDESMEIVLDDAIYQFCSVPRQIYNGFREAGSKGRFFNSRVKGLWDC